MNRMWVRLSIIYTFIIFAVALLLVSIIALIQPDAPRILQNANLTAVQEQAFVQLVESGIFEEVIRTAIFSQILGLFVLAIVAGVATSAWASWIITRPLIVLNQAIDSVSKRDFTENVDIQGTYEVENLASSFNVMVAELAAAEKRRQNLLADVAHELRTPLTVLQGNLRGALDNIYQFDQERIATLYTQVRQLNHLIDDLHDLAQAEANQLQLHMQDVQVNALVKQAVEIFSPLASETDITIETYIADDIPIILADRKRLMQVLQNLLSNAIRYARSEIHVRLFADDTHIILSIKDDGVGIPQEELVHIFDRFYRVDSSRTRATGGTGLGLAIVQNIVTAHDGTITATSQQSEHTTFTIQLPQSTIS
ncbi:MAG: ATP-binding protein [Chloroflexota bacterium]